MKALKSVMVGVFGLLFVVGGASAAIADDSVVARVPFAFVVSGAVLPPGDYVISRDTRHPDLVSIATADGRRTLLALSRGGSRGDVNAEQPKLEFERVGAQVYLSQVTLGPGSVRELAVPAAEVDAPRPAPAAIDSVRLR